MKERRTTGPLKLLAAYLATVTFVFAPLVSHALARDNNTQNQAEEPGVMDRGRQAVEDAARNVEETAGTTAEELSVTNEIRQEIMEDGTLTSKAKNVSVSTDDGTITLEGEVTSEAEKARVANIAQRVGGNLKLENKIEVNP